MEEKKKDYLSDWFHYLLLAFIGMSTYFYIPVNPNSQNLDALMWGYSIQELFFRYGTMFLFGISSFLRPKRSFTDKFFIIFVIYTLLSCAMKGFTPEMRHGLLNIFFGFIFYKTLVEHFDFKKLKMFGWMFFALACANLLWCGLQFIGQDPLFSDANTVKAGWQDTLVGLMRNKVHLGALVAVTAPLMLLVSPWLVIPCIPLLFISQSSAAALSFVISMGLIAYIKLSRRTFLLLVALLVLLGVAYIFFFDMPHGAFGSRFNVWFATISMGLRQDPYFGQGIGAFAKMNVVTVQTNGVPQNWIWTHNEFIQLFYETGFIGIGIAILFIIQNVKAMFVHKIKYLQDHYVFFLASFVAILCISFLHFPFHLGRFVAVFIFFMALLAAKREDYQYE